MYEAYRRNVQTFIFKAVVALQIKVNVNSGKHKYTSIEIVV